ncbi:MAG: sigma-70 family RNA polymerase sigma factor [Candidatus Eisenbacteria sp.]|nr:sigma-70 family RNA polymerase sigma factor [Candidatus Eisenbacteria bacterium]
MIDNETYKDIVRENKDRVFSHALYLLRCREDAEDATQEVFVRLWNHRNRIARRRVEAWIMRTAHNFCIDLLRKRQTCGSRMRRWPGADPDSFAIRMDCTANPEERYEFTRKQEALLSAMELLPEKTRSILLLHYFHGFKYKAIGEILGTKVGAVKVAVHRGRKALRRLLAESCLDNCGRRDHEEPMRQDQKRAGSLSG